MLANHDTKTAVASSSLVVVLLRFIGFTLVISKNLLLLHFNLLLFNHRVSKST